MELYIFKTDIQNQEKAAFLNSLFSQFPVVRRWTIDTEDIDNVLRIEATDPLSEREVIKEIKQVGFNCEILAY